MNHNSFCIVAYFGCIINCIFPNVGVFLQASVPACAGDDEPARRLLAGAPRPGGLHHHPVQQGGPVHVRTKAPSWLCVLLCVLAAYLWLAMWRLTVCVQPLDSIFQEVIRAVYLAFCRPHCDGDCDNSPHVKTGRVATAVLYCQVRLALS